MPPNKLEPFSQVELNNMRIYLNSVLEGLAVNQLQYADSGLWHIHDGFMKEYNQLQALINRIDDHLLSS